jgi:hypothetical protein
MTLGGHYWYEALIARPMSLGRAFPGATSGECRRFDWQVDVANGAAVLEVPRTRTTPGQRKLTFGRFRALWAVMQYSKTAQRWARPETRNRSIASASQRVVA